MIRNYYILSAFILTVLSLIPILFYIVPKQFAETRRPKNALTPVRWNLLILESSIAVTMIPGLPRMLQLIRIPASDNYAKVVAVTNRLPYLIIAIILWILYHQRAD